MDGSVIAEGLFVLGIDPGKTGAIAWLPATMISAQASALMPMPVAGDRGSRLSFVDALALYRGLQPYTGRIALCCIERARGTPGDGIASVFAYGEGYGTVLAVLAILGVPVVTVPPEEWQRVELIGMPRATRALRKKSAKLVAMRRWPDVTRNKQNLSDGEADALLLAAYAQRKIGQRMKAKDIDNGTEGLHARPACL